MNTTKMTKLLSTCGAVLLALSTPAQAQIEYTLGAGGAIMPDYSGSDDYEGNALPLIGVQWENETSTPQDGLAFGLHSAEIGVMNGLQIEPLRFQQDNHAISAKIGITPEFGRDEDDNKALNGLGDIDLHGAANLTLSYAPAQPQSKHFLTAEAELKHDITGETDSMTLGANIKGNHAFQDKTIISHGPHITWSNQEHMQSYYGINTQQAARSGRSQYNAQSGLHDAGYSITAKHRLSERLGLMVHGQYDRLLSDAADSPIVDQDGSASQFRVITGVSYSFQ